jgi:large subunit ribosomal protein L1
MSKKLAKKYAEALGQLDPNKLYSLSEAAELITKTSTTKFDSSVELHINLNVNVKHADQIVRGTLIPPHGTGKKLRIAAFVEGDSVKACKDAGADEVGLEELIQDVKKGAINFDVAVAQPQVMKHLGKVAKILGQKGLMPNPKSGTVTPDPVQAIAEIKKGKIEYKTDKSGIIHCLVAKVSFGADKIMENVKPILEAVASAKPSAIKGTYVKSVVLATSMGPGIKVDPAEVK